MLTRQQWPPHPPLKSWNFIRMVLGKSGYLFLYLLLPLALRISSTSKNTLDLVLSKKCMVLRCFDSQQRVRCGFYLELILYTGGFELMISQEKARKQLKVVSHGSCNTEQIRCFGNGRIYIRPLQRNIELTEETRLQDEMKICLSCT